MEKFSVLISVYIKDNPDWFRLSLDSIFTQTVMPDEVVLVEDGPLTLELDAVVSEYTARYPVMKVVALEKNRGLGLALNEGLLHCSFELVARMDSDDICKPNRFEMLLNEFEKDAELAVCGSWIEEFIDIPEHVEFIRVLPRTHTELFEFGKRRNPVNHPSCMFRKSSVLDSGNYQDFHLFEDYYLWARMMVRGYKFHCIQQSLLSFRFSRNMIKRRGGVKYAWTEVKFQWMLHKIGYINLTAFINNMMVRTITRLVPISMRTEIYKHVRKTT